MTKRNLVLHSAIASAILMLAGTASAGTVTAANTKFASEGFKTAAGTAITPGNVSYNFTSPNGNVNIGGIFYVQIRLTGATFVAAPAVGEFTIAGVAGAAAVVNSSTLSADKSTVELKVTAAAAMALGVNAVVWAPGAANVLATTAMGTPGSTVQALVNLSSVTSGVATTATLLDSTAALPASIDGTTAAVAIATSGAAVTGAVSNLLSGATPYSNKIDLTAAPAGSDYTTAGKIALGNVTFTTSTTAYNIAPAGVVPFTLEADSAAANQTASIVVTPGTGTFPVGSVLSYSVNDLTCAGGLSPTAAITSLTASTSKTLTVAAGDLTTATPITICLTKPSSPNLATPFTPVITASTVSTVPAKDTADTATGNGYPVDYNGQTKIVRNYIPAAVTGYVQTVRVSNTGSVAAPVSMTLIDEATGTSGSTVVVVANLAAGATARLSQAQIEAALGTVAASARPRIRVTAPTNGEIGRAHV